MIKLVKEYICSGHPSENDIQECVKISDNENCIVHLKWYIQYNGWNDTYIYPFEESVETILNKLPKIYSV